MTEDQKGIAVVTGIPEVDRALASGEVIENMDEFVTQAMSKYSRDELQEMVSNGSIPTFDVTAERELSTEDIVAYLNGDKSLAEIQNFGKQQAFAVANIAYTQFEQGKFKVAKELFTGLVALDDTEGYFFRVLGACHEKLGEDDEAVAALSKAIELDGADIFALVTRAEVHLRHARFNQALNDLTAAIELDPDKKDPSGLRARALAAATATVIQGVLDERNETFT